MKRVLFLDDDPRRTAEIEEHFVQIGIEYVAVETAEECIAALETGEFDLVLLDHDLGGEIYVDSSRTDTGMEVVRWLQKNPESRHGAFIVHTMNPMAAANMFMALQQMGHSVEQGTFGSKEFYGQFYRILGHKRKVKRRKKPLSQKINEYFRSLRLGK